MMIPTRTEARGPVESVDGGCSGGRLPGKPVINYACQSESMDDDGRGR